MSSSLKFQGLNEFKKQLQNLPSELTSEASYEVQGAANGAASDMKREYTVRETGLNPGPNRKSPWFPPGNLRDGVVVEPINAGRFGAGVRVKNTSPHATIFENGTQVRRNDAGANRGAMPPGHVFVPAAIRARRLMYERLKAMVKRAGFQVTSDGG